MIIKHNTFGEACFNQNTIQEIRSALKNEADEYDLKTWSITKKEYFKQLDIALKAKLIDQKYRFETGSVYEYCDNQKAYIFIGKLNGKTKKQFIEEYEQ